MSAPATAEAGGSALNVSDTALAGVIVNADENAAVMPVADARTMRPEPAV